MQRIYIYIYIYIYSVSHNCFYYTSKPECAIPDDNIYIYIHTHMYLWEKLFPAKDIYLFCFVRCAVFLCMYQVILFCSIHTALFFSLCMYICMYVCNTLTQRSSSLEKNAYTSSSLAGKPASDLAGSEERGSGS